MSTRMLGWLVLFGLAIFFVSRIYWIGYNAATDKVTAKWNAERASTFAAYNEALTSARQKQFELQDRIDSERKSFDEKITALHADTERLRLKLRNRTERPFGLSMPKAPGAPIQPGTGCTGAELYRQDGELLVREADRAERIRLALNSCIASYAHALEASDAQSNGQ